MCWKFRQNDVSLSDENAAKDSNQKEYREYFGIVDKYLIQYEYDINKKEGYIVYVDNDIDIDWVDTRSDYFTDDEKKLKQQWIAKLDALHLEPCTNICQADKLTFKKKLGVGYELVMVKCFDEVGNVIKECQRFIKSRNREVSRTLFLNTSIPVALIAIVVMIFNIEVTKWHPAWVSGFSAGILGAFISIWTRYGKTTMTGLSSKWLHYEETACRLLAGGVFALVAILAVKCGLLLNNIEASMIVYACSLVGFIAGFSERFIPSLVERITKDEDIYAND